MISGRWLRSAVVCAIALFACVTDGPELPAGSYVHGDEQVEITGHRITFRLLDKNGVPVMKEYEYAVSSDGEITPFTMTSAEALYGIGRFDWFWDQGAITRTDRRAKETVRFTRSQ